MMKKIISVILVVSLTAAIAIGGTLAYLTDRDSEANVFTTGDVNIDLNEDFNQGSTLTPGVEIEKAPTVTNVGPNEAWVWTTVAVPKDLASVIDFTGKGDGWETWTEGTTTIDNEAYVLYTILHTEALEVGDVTDVLFTTVTLDETVDIAPDGKWHTVEGGNATALGWTNDDGDPVIYVSAYAIQAEGFDTVADAYAAYNAQWAENGTEYGTPSTVTTVSTADELTAALNAGGTVVLTSDVTTELADAANWSDITGNTTINMNGNTLKINIPEDASIGNQHVFNVKKGGNLTIENGVFEVTYGDNQNQLTAIINNAGGTVVINGGEFKITKSGENGALIAAVIDNNTVAGDATVIINDGKFYSDKGILRNFMGSGNATVIINGGKFENGYIWNQKPSATSQGTPVVEINGGTFTENVKIYTSDYPDAVTVAEGVTVYFAN